MTSKKLGIALLSLVVLAIFAVAPAAAAQPFAVNISTGDTVFIGESGLNITGVLNNGTNAIAWYSAGSTVGTDTPKKVVTLTETQINSFYVDQGTFNDYLGPWYAYTDVTDAEFAFYVEKPSLSVGIFRDDGTTSIDGKKVIADDEVML
ncbi:MAG: DUF3821 domain-containing protein, partial [Methanomicrobium sp.]|nr:DUF3821 domain-containing protein [Methanomicrobium sp.]